MTTKELRQKYFKFFEGKGHRIVPSASLIPEHDPTVLFTTAGMHPLIPYLLGEKHPAGDKLVNNQKCIRTSDIEKVGNDTHLTFFEMLGNWGLGSYWKEDAIKWSWEFLTDKKCLGLDKDKISISCFKGDKDAPKDIESAKIWESMGVPKNRIKFLGREENWWGPAGKTGPCGPCTEMFYNGIEIWNDVFMEYNKTTDGKYEALKQRNVDTGMGLERTVAVLNDKKNVYDIEPLKSIAEKIKELATKQDIKAERIIADHLRAACFILAEEIQPSNLERGYVLRRLIRRAIDFGRELGIKGVFTFKIAEVVIQKMSDEYPELRKNKDFIIEQLVREEQSFSEENMDKKFDRYFDKYMKKIGKKPALIIVSDVFDLNTVHGIPIRKIKELAKKKNFILEKDWEKGFEKEFKKHQELSRTATAGKFKSGLADHSEEVTKLHTATHLLLAALRKVLGEHVFQKGSNITGERLRLDFSHPDKLTDEQLKKVEDLVNEQIKKDLLVKCEEMSLENAKKEQAIGVFETKYGDKVKVYSVGQFSKEICGGPHIKSTGELGHFKIKKQESSSAGVRRIKAVLE
jgi:alanyl-tRNA synthetase